MLDLTIEVDHTCYVDCGGEAILVHNCFGLDEPSNSGRRALSGDLTKAGQELEKHEGGQFPQATGHTANKSAIGRDVLDDILMTPGARVEHVTSGNFKGGVSHVTPDGRGATFDATGLFQYFGEC